MHWQHEYLRETVAADRGDTYRLDLPDHGYLGSLVLKLRGKKATGAPLAAVAKWRLIDEMDKIEVIGNGSEVIKSMVATQAAFCAFLDQKVVIPTRDEEYSQAYSEFTLLINFGRMLYDQFYGLDLSKFDSVELQITNSCSTSHWQDDLKYSIIAVWMRDPPAPFRGYMRTEEWRTWTTVADETQYLDIPTAYLLRRIIMQAWPDLDSNEWEETSIDNMMNDIELSLKTGQTRLWKGGIDDLIRWNVFDLGVLPFGYGIQYHTNDYGFYTGIGYTFAAFAGQTHKGSSDPATAIFLSAQENAGTQKNKNKTADAPQSFLALGLAYQNCGVWRFDHNPDPNTWLDPKAQQTVELNIHTRNASSAADGTNAVVLDRLVAY